MSFLSRSLTRVTHRTPYLDPPASSSRHVSIAPQQDIELTQNSDPHHDEIDLEDVRLGLQREESETTKIQQDHDTASIRAY